MPLHMWGRLMDLRLGRGLCTARVPLPPRCSSRDEQNGQGDRLPTDWDKAWASFRKQRGKRTLFSEFRPDKYVSWNPRPFDYPLSEEFDPIRRTERSNLRLWTSPQFTLAGAIVVVSLLLVYTLLLFPLQ